jgi:hypothetical protein
MRLINRSKESHGGCFVSRHYIASGVILGCRAYLSIYLSTDLQSLSALVAFFSFLIHTQSVGLLGRGMSPSQGRYLYRATQTQNINHTDVHVSSGIWTHDPSLRAGEDGSCLRPRSHCDGHVGPMVNYKWWGMKQSGAWFSFVPYFYWSKLHFI